MKLEFDDSGTIGKFKASGCLEEGKEHTIKTLRNALKGRVLEAWIFGSYARDEQSQKSDLDIILIVDTNKKFIHRIEDFEDLYSTISPDLDVLIYTPEEFRMGLSKTENGFWKGIRKDRIRII